MKQYTYEKKKRSPPEKLQNLESTYFGLWRADISTTNKGD